MARELEELYGDVDALEFYVGVMLEKRRSPLMFGQTITEVGSPFSLKGMFKQLSSFMANMSVLTYLLTAADVHK